MTARAERVPRRVLSYELAEPHRRRNLTHRQQRPPTLRLRVEAYTYMGILGRLSSLVKSNVNDAIDSMQDPGEGDRPDGARHGGLRAPGPNRGRPVHGARRSASSAASPTSTARSPTGSDRAETAVRAAEDGLAKEALRRNCEKEAERVEAQKGLQEQGVYVDQLTAALKALDARLKDDQAAAGDAEGEGPRPTGTAPRCRARRRPSTTSTGWRGASTRSRRRRGWTSELERAERGVGGGGAQAERALRAEHARRCARRAEEKARGRWLEIA